jgi:ketosteroid isomerase-like protein
VGTAENKELVRHLYSELSRGNSQPLREHLAGDVVWTIIGSTRLSGTFRGREEVTSRLFAGVAAALSGPIRFTFDRFVAEDDIVVMEARGEATSAAGRPYNNQYCVVFRLAGGKLAEITDYVDTELVTSSLFPADGASAA